MPPMTLLPNGRSERTALEAELAAAKEFQRLTRAYLARVRSIYPEMGNPTKRRVTPTLQHLRDLAGPDTWTPK
ncbi:hypothetical protein GCM10027430_25040 [Lysobacter tyrosinilyticus]